jgi:hypothetical protein
MGVVTVIEALQLVTSRDCLNRYYTRVGQLLGTQPPKARKSDG